MPNTLGTMGGIVNPVGFDHLPGLERGQKSFTHVLNDHFYCCQVDMKMCQKPGGEGEPGVDEQSAKICESFHRRRMTQRIKDARSLNIPLMITEFGACFDSDVCVREIN